VPPASFLQERPRSWRTGGFQPAGCRGVKRANVKRKQFLKSKRKRTFSGKRENSENIDQRGEKGKGGSEKKDPSFLYKKGNNPDNPERTKSENEKKKGKRTLEGGGGGSPNVEGKVLMERKKENKCSWSGGKKRRRAADKHVMSEKKGSHSGKKKRHSRGERGEGIENFDIREQRPMSKRGEFHRNRIPKR